MSVRLVDMQLIVQNAREVERQHHQQQGPGQPLVQSQLVQEMQKEMSVATQKPNKLEQKEKAKTEDSQITNRSRRYQPGKRETGHLDIKA